MRWRSPTVRNRYWPSGENAICAPNCPPRPLRHLAPQHLESLQARRVLADRQLRARAAPGSIRRRPAPNRSGRRCGRSRSAGDRNTPSMPPWPWRRTAGTFATGVLSPCWVTSQTGPTFSVIEHASIGQERDAPGQIERRHLRHRERQVTFGRQRAGVDLRLCGGRRERQQQRRGREFVHGGSHSSNGRAWAGVADGRAFWWTRPQPRPV